MMIYSTMISLHWQAKFIICFVAKNLHKLATTALLKLFSEGETPDTDQLAQTRSFNLISVIVIV